MAEHLPELIDPLALAEKRSQFKGFLPLSKMTRMQDILLHREGEVSFELRFGKDDKFAVVTGIVEAHLELQCQCCLEPIVWPVSSQVNLAIVSSLDQADLLPEPYEPLLLEEESISLTDIIQEELLLAVPSIPQHRQCEASPSPSREGEPQSAMPGRPNPFAVLAKLKKY
jgi:uncharacterized protein